MKDNLRTLDSYKYVVRTCSISGVSCRVERCQTLDESRDRHAGLCGRYVVIHLQKIEHDVWGPTEHEHCKKNAVLEYKSIWCGEIWYVHCYKGREAKSAV